MKLFIVFLTFRYIYIYIFVLYDIELKKKIVHHEVIQLKKK